MTPYTKDRPTEGGWYWFRGAEDSPGFYRCCKPEVARITKGGDDYFWFAGVGLSPRRVNQMGGEFSGPIPEPPKPEGAKT